MRQRTCVTCKYKFIPDQTSQRYCGEECLIEGFDKLKRKTRATARAFALQLNYKSMSEVRFAVILKNAGINAVYEPDTFKYQFDPQTYTPDWRIDDIKQWHRGYQTYLEYKGKLDKDTRKKLLAVKRCNPELDLRLIFEKPNNKLYKGSRTMYWQWAEKNNFQWYSKQDIIGLKRDLSK